ncbi:MAG: CRTAC1 family protein [Planctomycetota bacterium]
MATLLLPLPWLALLGTAFLLVPCAAGAQLSFSDQTAAAGLTHLHNPAADHPGAAMHAGGTVGDFNNDGWPDLFVVGGGSPDTLFINNQDGTFTDQAAAWGLTDLYRGCGCIAGDYDGDGWEDLFVTSFGDMSAAPAPGQHRLYHNNGNGTFTNVAVQAGVNFTAATPSAWGAVFGDYDLDGHLDLFVCSWERRSGGNRLFHNNGDGTFTDVTVQAGVFTLKMKGFSPRFVDMDGDRFPELLVAADFNSSHYYHNNGDGTFTDLTPTAGVNEEQNGMGSAVGDFNGDGLFDWFVTAIIEPVGIRTGNRLYINQGGNLFQALPASAGVNSSGWAWGASAVDVDHDGFQDIAGTNGWPVGGDFQFDRSFIFHNDGTGTSWTDVGWSSGFRHTGQGRGLYHMDYDGDGDMDIVICSWKEPLALFRNDLQGPGTRWLQVDLETRSHPGLAPRGMGARVEVTAGGFTRHVFVDGGCTYLGRSQRTAHFGLGASGVADVVKVEWPDGFETVLGGVAADQALTVHAAPPLTQGPLQRGKSATLTVHGARPGEEVIFLASFKGAGAGPAKGLLGFRCLGLLPPVRELGRVVAAADGSAVLTLPVPPHLQQTSVATQAVIARGTAGRESALSNVLTAPILP